MLKCTQNIDTCNSPPACLSDCAELLKRLHNFTARSHVHHSLDCSASACRTEVLKAVKDLIRQLQEEQVARRQTDPRGRGSPEQLQDLARSCNLEQIHVVMQALEKENEHL